MVASTTEIKISGKNFAKAVSYAKRARGTYNASSKTWSVPSTCTMLGNPRAYGWTIVPATADRAVCAHCGTYCSDDCLAR